MAYATGTITNNDPGPALYAALATPLTTAGLTLVDTVIIGARTHKVWKSAAGSNTVGKDWYLDIGYLTTGTGTSGNNQRLVIQAFEDFNPTTDLAYRGSYGSGTSLTIDATTYSPFGSTGYALETNWWGNTSNNQHGPFFNATTITYWVSATPERFIFLSTLSEGALQYAGFYQPSAAYASKAGAALYPLLSCYIASGYHDTQYANSNYGCGLTRVPPITTMLGRGWGDTLRVMCGDYYLRWATPPLPTGSTTAMAFTAYPINLTSGVSSLTALYTTYGVMRDVASITTAPSVLRGDTCTIGSDQWVLTTYNGTYNGSLLFKAV